MDVYVVIPAYQPDARLVELVLGLSLNELEVIVIDDGSGADYSPIFNQLNCPVIAYPENQGKGYALRQGFKALKEKSGNYIVVTCDCDGQHSLADIIRISNQAKEHPSTLILGSREFSGAGVPLKSRLGNTITAKIFNIITASHVSDTQTGLRAFSSSMIQQMIEIKGDTYEYEMNVLMVLAKGKQPIIEMPIETIYNDDNKGSHFKAVRDSFRIYLEIIKFASSSFVSFLVDFAMYSLLLSMQSVLIANIGARLISATVNFTLNRKYVFKSDTHILTAAVKYIALAAGVLVVNSTLLVVLTEYVGLGALLSKVIVEISLFLINWLIQRKLIFREGDKPCLNIKSSCQYI